MYSVLASFRVKINIDLWCCEKALYWESNEENIQTEVEWERFMKETFKITVNDSKPS